MRMERTDLLCYEVLLAIDGGNNIYLLSQEYGIDQKKCNKLYFLKF
jgi:hypothetical protein